MIDGLTTAALSTAKAAGGAAVAACDRVAEHVDATKGAASEYTLKQLQQALEGSCEKVASEPDVHITLVKVAMQDGMKVDDLFEFRLSGLKCRVRLEVKGSVAQLAAMVAAGAAMGALGKFKRLTGLGSNTVGERLAGVRSGVAAKAREAEETKSVEFDVNLDLGVRRGGEEVNAVVTIGKEWFAKIDKIVPVSKATAYVQEAIARRVKEIITNWAKEKAKRKAKGVLGDTGYEYAKVGVKTSKATYDTAAGVAAGAASTVTGALSRVNEAIAESRADSKRPSEASSVTSV
mmetsp:Transcript_124619/g.338536  ORF Transcript_124619/g.338536 Transcript_124619/m.338536 type:complete len:291 (-) Transcript_124619:117-989(-)